MDSLEVRRLKVILLVSSLVCLALLLLSAYEEHFSGTWRAHQLDYRAATIAAAPSESARLAAAALEVGYQQIYLRQLNRVDRCTTCHIAIADPRFVDAEQPLRTHSGEVLKHHPPEKFGCTVCHDGQGRAVDQDAAHGDVPHWSAPLLRGELLYTSCSRCHFENDLYGWGEDLYAQRAAGVGRRPIDGAELAASLPAAGDPRARSLARGKRLMLRSGCLGCHKYRGRGGTLGPDITYVGDKTAHDFDFTRLAGERTMARWLFEHFKRPAAVSPGSLMPDMGLTDEQARDLTNYMLSLHQRRMPATHTPLPSRRRGTPASGRQLYGMFCSACHGERGFGATVRDPALKMVVDAPRELLAPSLNHPDTLAVASDDYLRMIIAGGRHDTSMLAWDERVGGLKAEEIDRLVAYIRSWEDAPATMAGLYAIRGNPRFGRALYRSRCVGCHGKNGAGGVGVALNAPAFLAAAGDELIAMSIVHGRANTAMPSWKQLSEHEVADLLAYIRRWQQPAPDKQEVLARLAETKKPTRRSLRIGKSLFRSRCAACHGNKGQGALGPSLNTTEFLSLVDDDYLYAAIVGGRPGTAMPAWTQLSADDVVDLIGYVRSLNKQAAPRVLEPYVAGGDWDRGQVIFQGTCAGCHGRNAEGGTGPQLANRAFLRSASDAMLREWISRGKSGTEMRAFLKGQQGVAELTEAQIADVVTYLRHLEVSERVVIARQGIGNVQLGAELYAGACLSCHGAHGEGATGSALSNPDFLRSASDGYLAATIVLGRDGTEMLPMGAGMQGNLELSGEQVGDVVAYIRSWGYQPPVSGIPARYVTGADLNDGAQLYAHYCAGCHGASGDDGWAPALNNRDFLAAASDGFLQATIARGRDGTAMRPFGTAAGGVADLTGEQINNIVAYLRMWAAPGNKPSDSPADRGERAVAATGTGSEE